MLDVPIAFPPNPHCLPIYARNNPDGGKWSSPKTTSESVGSERRLGGDKGGIKLTIVAHSVLHVNRKGAVGAAESPMVSVPHIKERRDVKLFVEIERALTGRAIMNVGMTFAPWDVCDFSDDGLKFSITTVRKVEGDRIELMPEVSGVGEQVHISDVREPENPVDPLSHFCPDGLMLVESEVTLVPTRQVLLIG